MSIVCPTHTATLADERRLPSSDKSVQIAKYTAPCSFLRCKFFMLIAAAATAIVANGCSGGPAATPLISSDESSFALAAKHRPSPSPTPTSTSAVGWQQAQWSDAFVSSIGINTHFSYTGSVYDSTNAESSLKALGVRHIRDNSPNSTQQGHFAHLAPYGVHFDVIWQTAYFPPPVSSWSPTPNAYATTVGLTDFDSYEGTNESNLSCTNNSSWVTQTKTEQSDLYAYMQANGLSSLALLAPSYGACNGIANMLADASSMGSLAAYSNYGNLHSYPGKNNFPEAGCLTAAQSANCGGSYWLEDSNIENPGQPVTVTETGYESQAGGCQWNAGTVGQERYDLRELLNNWNSGIVKTYLFEFLDDHADDECYLGIVNDSYAVKPAYTAIANLIATLADPGSTFSAGAMNYSLGGSLAHVNNVLLQKRTGIFELLLWQAVASVNSSGSPLNVAPQTVTLTFAAQPISISAQTFTNTGSLTSVAVTSSGNVSSLPVTDIPVIVTINI